MHDLNMADEVLSPEEAEQYLARIHFSGPKEPTIDVLSKLQQCHMLSVPFENLSVYGKEKIFPTKDWLFDKIVRRHRGGFCYELNTLYSFLLDYFGFNYKSCSSQVFAMDTGEFGPPFDHKTLVVNIEGKHWLSDVGFGDFSMTPLLVTGLGEEQHLQSGIYRIRKDGDVYILDEKYKVIVDESGQEKLAERKFCCPGDPGWKPKYQFDLLTEVTTPDFNEMLEYHQTNPESPFTHDRICTIAKPWGRLTLTGNKLTTSTYLGNNRVKKESKELSEEEEIVKELEDKFGIKRNC